MRHPSSRGSMAAALVLTILIGQPVVASTSPRPLAGERHGHLRRAVARAQLGRAKARRVNPLAATLKQFQDRVDAYRKVRAQAVAGIGTLPKTNDPAVIADRQQTLADAIRKARADAKPGDIFTPHVASVIRRFIARDLARRRPVDRRAFVVEQPDVHLRVNDFYPLATVPLATVPPRLLKQLPRLPGGLEYRFVGSTLILRDVDPNLVVDLLPDAIPARYRKQ
jgi:hypothetical protein